MTNKEETKVNVTPFQQKVYDAICKIPKGKVTTYKLLADYLKCKSCQAVGQALKRNPFAPTVPCHRVIKRDRTIGGFSGQISGELIDKKVKRLTEEGVSRDSSGKFDSKFVFDLSSLEQ